MSYRAFVDGYRVEIRRGDAIVGAGRWTGTRIEGGPPILPGAVDEEETRAIYRRLEAEARESEAAALSAPRAAEDDAGVDLTLIEWAARLGVEERLRMVGGARYDAGAMLGVLLAHRVDFIVVGGTAAVLHGAPIVTADVDVLYSQHPGNVARLLEALEDLDAVFRGDLAGRRIRPNATHLTAGGRTQRLETRFGPLDLLSIAAWPSRSDAPEVAGGERSLTYEALHGEAVAMEVGGARVDVAPLERIVEAKRIAGRPKDVLALVELEAVLRSKARGDGA